MDDDWKITIYLPNWHLFIKTKNRSMWIYDYFDLIQLRFWNAVISSSFEWNSFQKLLYHYLEINVVWQKFDRFSTKTKIHNVRTIHHLCVKLSKGLVVEYILYKITFSETRKMKNCYKKLLMSKGSTGSF